MLIIKQKQVVNASTIARPAVRTGILAEGALTGHGTIARHNAEFR